MSQKQYYFIYIGLKAQKTFLVKYLEDDIRKRTPGYGDIKSARLYTKNSPCLGDKNYPGGCSDFIFKTFGEKKIDTMVVFDQYYKHPKDGTQEDGFNRGLNRNMNKYDQMQTFIGNNMQCSLNNYMKSDSTLCVVQKPTQQHQASWAELSDFGQGHAGFQTVL